MMHAKCVMAKVGCHVRMQIKVALAEHGHMDIVVACIKSCVQRGLAWVAAALSLELLRKKRLDVSRLPTPCLPSAAGLMLHSLTERKERGSALLWSSEHIDA